MKLSELDVIEQLKRLGGQLIKHPERFTGNVTINSFEGGVTNLNVAISLKVSNGDVT